MNKITGANKVSDKDIERIKLLHEKGLKIKEIAEITGWSEPVCRRAARGYLREVNEERRKSNAEKAATEREQAREHEQLTIPVRAAETTAETKIVAWLALIGKMLAAICDELGVSVNE